MYDVVPYYLAKLLIDIPIVGFVQFLFTCIIYFGIGMTITANQFFIFFAAIYLTGETAASLGYFISSIFQHEETAVELAPIVVMPLILFGGQFSNSGTLQSWISWLQYISPIRYAFEVLVTNEYDERKYNATMIMRSITSNYTVTILDAFATSSSSSSFNSSQWEIEQYPEQNPKTQLSFELGIWKCCVILAALLIIFKLLALFFLKVLVKKFQ